MAVFEDGLAGTTTTTGTGSYVVTGDLPGYREISQIADGQARVFVIRTASDFEVGLYTKSGGSSPVLARTTIYKNRDGGSAAVNWGSGEKTIHSTVSAAVLSALNDAGVRTAHLLMRGVRLALDEDDDSYFYSDADDNIVGVLANVEFLRLYGAAPPNLRLQWADAGTGVGPALILDRASPSPAVNDIIGGLWFRGRNSAGGETNYVRIEGLIEDPTNGSEDGGLVVSLYRAGADINALMYSGSGVKVFPFHQSSNLALIVGKAAQGGNVVGAEVRSDGLGAFITDNITCLLLNRKNGDGQLVSLARDGVEVGSITVASGVVTYGAFVGNHPSLPAAEIVDLPLGAVLCTVDEPYDPRRRPHLPMFRLSQEQGEKRVYGVFAGIDGNGEFLINALGAWQVLVTGPIEGGDLLWSSATPGVAARQPDEIVRACTIGKVSMGDGRTDTRLVAAVLYCG